MGIDHAQKKNDLAWRFGRYNKQMPIGLFLIVWWGLMCNPSASNHRPFTNDPNDQMIETQIIGRGLTDRQTIEAMRKVKREHFVSKELRHLAYEDHPLPIGEGQTISQPYIVALMTSLLKLTGRELCLEIGTGSGYQAAVLSHLCREVHTIEIKKSLYRQARERFKRLGYKRVFVHYGDGYKGLPEKAPFDRIIITAAPPAIPQSLVDQLKVGGIMVLPVGRREQELVVLYKTQKGLKKKTIIPVRFVPMVRGDK